MRRVSSDEPDNLSSQHLPLGGVNLVADKDDLVARTIASHLETDRVHVRQDRAGKSELNGPYFPKTEPVEAIFGCFRRHLVEWQGNSDVEPRHVRLAVVVLSERQDSRKAVGDGFFGIETEEGLSLRTESASQGDLRPHDLDGGLWLTHSSVDAGVAHDGDHVLLAETPETRIVGSAAN